MNVVRLEGKVLVILKRQIKRQKLTDGWKNDLCYRNKYYRIKDNIHFFNFLRTISTLSNQSSVFFCFNTQGDISQATSVGQSAK